MKFSGLLFDVYNRLLPPSPSPRRLTGDGRSGRLRFPSTSAAAAFQLGRVRGRSVTPRRSIMGTSSKSQQDPEPEVVSVHLQSTSTVLDDLRGQATWEEDWMDANPGMVTASNHERKVHLLSDLLANADGVLAFREVLASTPALRDLMSEPGSDVAASEGAMVVDEANYHLVGEKLGERGGSTMFANPKGGAREDTRGGVGGVHICLPSLLDRGENSSCADCTAKLPTWASVNTGVFLCTQCAGCHRSLGVHISKVLSVQLDDWTRDQVDFMSGMGNGMANSFLEYHVPHNWLKPSHLEPRDYREAYVKAKYQDRLFEFRAKKKPIIKPPPEVSQFSSSSMSLSNGGGGEAGGAALERRVSLSQQGMTEYIGFVNIVLVRGENLVSPGFGQQLHYMAVLRIGGQEVRSRPAKADGSPSWSEKLMLCWDGGMPLVIEMYGGKEHIGQAKVPLRKLLLDEEEEGDGVRPVDRSPGKPASEEVEGTLELPAAAENGGNFGEVVGVERAAAPTPTAAEDEMEEDHPATDGRVGCRESTCLDQNHLGTPKPTTAAAATPVAKGGRCVLAKRASSQNEAFLFPDLTLRNPRYIGFSAATPPPPISTLGEFGSERPWLSSVCPLAKVNPHIRGCPEDGACVVDVMAFPKKLGSIGRSRRVVERRRGVCVPAAESNSSPIEVLPGGELYITLEDKKDYSTVPDRFTGLSPMAAPASVGSSTAPSPRPTPRGNNSRTASPRPAVPSRGSMGGNMSGSTSSKSFNSMILKLGKGGGASGGGGGSSGQAPSRPAQGGVVIKMDFVRIEH
ncbi:unnamed protein product [Scytosiphon promiscuus]